MKDATGDFQRCGAKLRRQLPGTATRFCRKPPVSGRNRCRLHGGATPRGLEHPRTNRQSLAQYHGADLPTQLAARYQAALNDPELGSLARSIALVRARMAELVDRFPTKESAEAWARVDTLAQAMDGALVRLQAAHKAANAEAANAEREGLVVVLAGLRDALGMADAERIIWRELFDAQEQERRLTDTERKREEMLAGTVTARQGQMLFGALLATIVEEVQDPDTKRRILVRLRGLLTAGQPVPSALAPGAAGA